MILDLIGICGDGREDGSVLRPDWFGPAESAALSGAGPPDSVRRSLRRPSAAR
ncbi:hypothetical protein [Actinoplanes sp. NPDC020271]|uniref:hypothetical protein n=1 Tax=Actinoplanes sp. NPDC020271 TaxID=3363896 RepID=UPI00378F381B